MKKKVGIAAVLLALGGPVEATESDGNSMLTACNMVIKRLNGQAVTEAADNGQFYLCMGIIEGVVSSSKFFGQTHTPDESPICIPNGVSRGQVVRVVVKYLTDHPKILHADRGSLTSVALYDAYPCQP